MSEQKDRDELVRVICDQDTALADVSREQAEVIADAVLSSAWLREHDAQVWGECLDTIERYEINTEQAREGNPYRAHANGEGNA